MHVIETLGIGGAERLLVAVLPALQKQGTQVSVAVMRCPLDLKGALEKAGIPVDLLPLRHKWNVIGSAIDLARLARGNRVDIIHAHLYFPAICTSLVRLLRLYPAPTIVTFHNLAYLHGVNAPGIGLRLKKIIASFVYPKGLDRKTAVSQAVASHYQATLGLDKVSVIHNPVDVSSIDQLGLQTKSVTSDVLHIVLPGRLVVEKGHTDLLKALSILSDQGHRMRVTLAGGGPLHDDIVLEVEMYGISDYVSITGVLEHQTMLEIIASADIVVVPSRYEGFGLTAIEAMALSKPVIATNAGGLAEIVEHEVNGIVVPSSNPESLAAAIGELVNSSELRKQLGEAGRQRVEREFALPLIVKKMQDIYVELDTLKQLKSAQ